MVWISVNTISTAKISAKQSAKQMLFAELLEASSVVSEFSAMDTNHDAKVKKGEWVVKYGSDKDFDAHDRNHDGVVSINEFKKVRDEAEVWQKALRHATCPHLSQPTSCSPAQPISWTLTLLPTLTLTAINDLKVAGAAKQEDSFSGIKSGACKETLPLFLLQTTSL